MTTPPLANIEILILGPTPAVITKLSAAPRKVITSPEPKNDGEGIATAPLVEWLQACLDDPDGLLPKGRDIFSSSELVALYDPFGEENITPTRLANTLMKLGAKRATNGRNVQISGTGRKYYAFRNVDYWAHKATHAEVVSHIISTPLDLD